MKRHWIQLLATVFTNGYVAGFIQGTVFKGRLKAVCVPGLNCYSCPGALGACPIGALQSVLGSRHFSFSCYVLGLILLFGLALGRVICGFLCPFGFIQDLLHKLPTPKPKLPGTVDRPLRWLKYLLLVVFVVLLPIFAVDRYGTAAPAFCKFLCPVGTLEGGLPLLLAHDSLRQSAGLLFGWKLTLLAAVLVAAALLYRPFCKYLCPLGALYGLLNRVSFYRMSIDREKCVDCKTCEQVCPMQVPFTKDQNHAECIRCGACRRACPHNAICSGLRTGAEKQ